mgnify:CR=1 FL=1
MCIRDSASVGGEALGERQAEAEGFARRGGRGDDEVTARPGEVEGLALVAVEGGDPPGAEACAATTRPERVRPDAWLESTGSIARCASVSGPFGGHGTFMDPGFASASMLIARA